MKPGDIGWVSFPHFDGSGYNRRPVLIIYIGPTGLGEDEVVVIAQITAAEDRVANPLRGDLVIDEWATCGLIYESIVRCRQLVALQPNLILNITGTVEFGTLVAAQEEVRVLLDP